jgi:RNA polymerase sigma-70 factor (ECF subfamily)
MQDNTCALVLKAQQGDKSAFNQLVHQYQTFVYKITLGYVKNHADAEDMTQETFIRAFQNLHQLKEPEKFAGWLRTIAENLSKRWMSQYHEMLSWEAMQHDLSLYFVQGQVYNYLQQPILTPAEVYEAKEFSESILTAIDALSEKNRVVVEMFYLDGLSYQEISTVLKVPVTTVESRLFRARKQLKQEMIKMLEEQKEKALSKVTMVQPGKDAEGRKSFLCFTDESQRSFVLWYDMEKCFDFDYAISGSYRSFYGAVQRIFDAFEISVNQAIIEDYTEATLSVKLRNTQKDFRMYSGDAAFLAYRAEASIYFVEDFIAEMAIKDEQGILLNPKAAYQKAVSSGFFCQEIEREGILEAIRPEGFSFVTCHTNHARHVYVAPSIIRRFGLKEGDKIRGLVRVPYGWENYYALLFIKAVNGKEPVPVT